MKFLLKHAQLPVFGLGFDEKFPAEGKVRTLAVGKTARLGKALFTVEAK